MHVLTPAERVARARATLRAAEERTGARSLSVVPAAEVAATLGSVDAGRRPARAPRPAVGPSAPQTRAAHPAVPALQPAEETPSPEALAPRLAPSPPDQQGSQPDRQDSPQNRQGSPPDRPVPLHAVDTIISTERPPLPVPPELAPLLPAGLRRGITIQVDGSTSVLLALLSEASRAGSWAAVVGAPSIGLLAVAQAGIDLNRLVLVPAPGAQAAPALAALLDGMDLVVVGPEVSLLGADRRRLVARARERASIIVSLRPWEGAHMTLAAERSRWAGLGAGRGRLSSREMTVTRTDRAHGITYRHTVTLPFAHPGTAPARDLPARAETSPLEASPLEIQVSAPVVVPVQPSFAQVG